MPYPYPTHVSVKFHNSNVYIISSWNIQGFPCLLSFVCQQLTLHKTLTTMLQEKTRGIPSLLSWCQPIHLRYFGKTKCMYILINFSIYWISRYIRLHIQIWVEPSHDKGHAISQVCSGKRQISQFDCLYHEFLKATMISVSFVISLSKTHFRQTSK